jgi:hypothetical protein
LPRQLDLLCDPALMARVVHLRQPHQHDAPALGDEGVGRLLRSCARELCRGDVIVGLYRRATGL